jgi:hypothetical protein
MDNFNLELIFLKDGRTERRCPPRTFYPDGSMVTHWENDTTPWIYLAKGEEYVDFCVEIKDKKISRKVADFIIDSNIPFSFSGCSFHSHVVPTCYNKIKYKSPFQSIPLFLCNTLNLEFEGETIILKVRLIQNHIRVLYEDISYVFPGGNYRIKNGITEGVERKKGGYYEYYIDQEVQLQPYFY